MLGRSDGDNQSGMLLHLYRVPQHVGLDLRRVDLYDALDVLPNSEAGKVLALDGPDEGTSNRTACLYEDKHNADRTCRVVRDEPRVLGPHDVLAMIATSMDLMRCISWEAARLFGRIRHLIEEEWTRARPGSA